MKFFIREDYRMYREGILSQGFWALQFHRFGYARKNFRSPLIRKPWGFLHLLLCKFSQIFFGIYIGTSAKIGRRFTIEHFGGIIIHNNAEIGDDVIIHQGVTIGNRNVEKPLDVPVIGNRVNIGAGAKILGGIVIGDDVSVGANAVVLIDVPPNCIAVGVPAVIKKKREKVFAL